MQALYQMQLTGDSAAEIERQFLEDNDMKRVDTTYFHELLSGVAAKQEELLESIEPKLDRKMDEIDPVEKAILRKGNSLFQKKKKAENLSLAPAETNSSPQVPAKANSPTETLPDTNSTIETTVPVLRLSGAVSPPPAEVFPPEVHISGQ